MLPDQTSEWVFIGLREQPWGSMHVPSQDLCKNGKQFRRSSGHKYDLEQEGVGSENHSKKSFAAEKVDQQNLRY